MSVSVQDSLAATDRWSFKPALVSLLTVASLQFICQLPGALNLILIPVLLLVYVFALLSIPTAAVYCIVKKQPRKASSVFLMLLLPVLLWLPINRVGDLIHVALTAGFSLGQLGVPSKSSDGNFVAYDWSVGLVTNPATFLIRDTTDEIALPISQHKHPLSDEIGFGEECAGKVHHLISHYYVCSF